MCGKSKNVPIFLPMRYRTSGRRHLLKKNRQLIILYSHLLKKSSRLIIHDPLFFPWRLFRKFILPLYRSITTEDGPGKALEQFAVTAGSLKEYLIVFYFVNH
jgi:hypothetical protein